MAPQELPNTSSPHPQKFRLHLPATVGGKVEECITFKNSLAKRQKPGFRAPPTGGPDTGELGGQGGWDLS